MARVAARLAKGHGERAVSTQHLAEVSAGYSLKPGACSLPVDSMDNPPDRRRAWVTQVLAGQMVQRAAAALAPAEVIPVKGVLLGRLYYDDPSERAMSDCDLVVLGAGIDESVGRLTRVGFRVRTWSNDPFVATLCDPALPGIDLDLHARPLSVGSGGKLFSPQPHEASAGCGL